MPEEGKRATLHDVAQRAGVSYQTVSRVVNEHPNVAKATRARVVAAIRALDYRPNQAAKVLATGRSHTLQLVTFELSHHAPLPSIIYWSRHHGYNVALTELSPDMPAEEIREKLEELAARMVDGVLLISPYTHPPHEQLQELCSPLPFVVLGTEVGADLPSVVCNQRAGIQLAVEHLIRLGHRQIAEISGPLGGGERQRENLDARTRHRAYLETLAAHNLGPGPTRTGDFTIPGGYQTTHKLLEQEQPFTALLVGNDEMAIGAIRALREHRRRVPEDVSVVGFDDITAAAYLEPPLTTVRQDFACIGKHSVKQLIRLIEDADGAVQQMVLPPELVVRQSTCPLRR